MKRCLILSLILVFAIAGTATLPATAADGCPAPKIYVTPTTLNAEGITADQATALNDAFSIGLRNANPGVSIISANDVGAMIDFERQKILLGEDGGEAQAFESIGRSTSAEYIATLSVSSVGARYVVASSLIDADLFTVVARSTAESASPGGLPDAVGNQVAGLGDLAALIQAHETANPAPPRTPSLSVVIQPESVTAEDIRDTTTITVTVRNCGGEVVPGTRVYFESRTSRGWVTAGGGESTDAAYYGWQVATTGADGTARATYRLDPARGAGAGSDKVAIATVGRGRHEVRSKADIPITGIILEARPKDAQIPPRGATDIYLSLFELRPDGEKRPLADRTLFVEKFRLSGDVKVSVAGPVDGDGNPVTGADGTAVLKFVAGEKEGLEQLRILFQDVGTGYQDAIESRVEIAVKKDEYVSTINWKESGTLLYEYSFQDQYDLRDYHYTFVTSATTTKEKNSGQELTDASFTYTDVLSLYSEGRTMYEASPLGGSGAVPFEEEWEIRSNVQGTITDHQSINTVLKERLSTLEIPVTPFPVAFDVTGSCNYHGSLLLKTGGAGQKSETNGQVAATRSVTIPGRAPMTGIVANTLSMPSMDAPDYGTVRFLRRQSETVTEQMSGLKDPKISGMLVKTGKNVYEKRWSVRDSNEYHGQLFTFYEYEARMDLESTFTRDVTLRAVKQ
ncbi:MAG TPA: hypothetical protein ENN44_05230 [Methanoculleus sp.]|nr:hypothetical protein [Methanoculleus sp.]